MLNYIDQYLSSLNSLKIQNNFDKKLIVNINYRGQNNANFCNDICQAIRKHQYLSDYFTLGMPQSNKYIFHNAYCLFFSNKNSDFNQTRIIADLFTLFNNERKRVLSLNIINPAYLYEIIGNETISEDIETLLICINNGFLNIIQKDNKYNKNKIFLFGVLLSRYLINTFGLTTTHTLKFCKYLQNKWLPGHFLQDVKHDQIQSKIAKRENDFKHSYDLDISIYTSIQEYFGRNETVVFDDIDLIEIQACCNSLISNVAANYYASNLVSLCVDIEDLSDKDKTNCWVITNVLESLLDIIGIQRSDRSYFAYILRMSIR